MIKDGDNKFDDYWIFAHWDYELTEKDFSLLTW